MSGPRETDVVANFDWEGMTPDERQALREAEEALGRAGVEFTADAHAYGERWTREWRFGADWGLVRPRGAK